MRSLSCFLASVFMLLVLFFPVTSQALDLMEDTYVEPDNTTGIMAGSPKSMDEIAQDMSNPHAAFYSLGYQFEYRTYQGNMAGADDQNGIGHTFRLVIPFGQKENGKGWVLRASLPYYPDQPVYWTDERGYAQWRIRQEDPTLDEGGFWAPTHGHTDAVSADLVYGGVSDIGFILMYGIASILPTTSDTSNGRQQLILGPEVNVGMMTDWGSYGAAISHIIDVAEKKDKGTPDTTQTTIEGYFSYGLGNGWQLISNPVITYDWEGDSGNKLSLPLGGGIAKTVSIGKMPLRITAEVQKYVASTNRFDSDWLFKFSLTPVYPSRHTRN
jgi:hypothetical protein